MINANRERLASPVEKDTLCEATMHNMHSLPGLSNHICISMLLLSCESRKLLSLSFPGEYKPLSSFRKQRGCLARSLLEVTAAHPHPEERNARRSLFALIKQLQKTYRFQELCRVGLLASLCWPRGLPTRPRGSLNPLPASHTIQPPI